ncbi:MAG: electron transfer flavoprotein subunit alpha/FixB family protein [Thermaerobacterales bacterium]
MTGGEPTGSGWSDHPEGALWVYLETQGRGLTPVTLELLGKARELADTGKLPLIGILAGNGAEALSFEAARYGADGVISLAHPALQPFSPELYTEVMTELIERFRPEILLLGATPKGRDLAGRLAVRLRTGLTADGTDLEIDAGGLLRTQVAGFGGGVLATILCAERRPQMATVRPGVFLRPEPQAIRTDFRVDGWDVGRILERLAGRVRTVKVVEHRRRPERDITKAPVLVIAGGGVHGNMQPLHRLAALLGGEVAATRVPIDEGWIERAVQIGQTGLSARPEVAIVLGASGAFQFTVGIQGAGTIIAVNTDPEALIFEGSDYGVVGDAVELAEALLEELAGPTRSGVGVHRETPALEGSEGRFSHD